MEVNRQSAHEILKSFDIKPPGGTGKTPARESTPHNQADGMRQNLAELDRNEALPAIHGPVAGLILVSSCSNSQLVAAIKSGATAYLARETTMEEMEQLAHVGGSVQADPQKGKSYRLTEREIEILQHVANGSTYTQIGKALGISEHTVKNHMSLVLRKLNANGKTHAMMLALKYGILSLNEATPSQTIK